MRLDTPLCDFGWQAPAFALPNIDGSEYRFDGRSRGKATLVAFICNHCPYVKAIIERLASDAAALIDEGVEVVAIMPNDYLRYPADSPEKMRQFAAEHALPFPYLLDADQSVARAWGAVCTPDFFGLNADGELQYRGRLDDARMGDPTDRVPELLTAMRAIAATGQGPREQQASMGCSIKWKEQP